MQFTAGVPAALLLSQNLVVTEIMYDPPFYEGISGDHFEFLELQNVGTNTLEVGGLTFSAGIDFTFTNGTLLAPGASFLLARDAVAMALRSRQPRMVRAFRLCSTILGGVLTWATLPIGEPVLRAVVLRAQPTLHLGDGF